MVKNGLIIVLVVLVIGLLVRGCVKTNSLFEKINNLEQQAIAIDFESTKERKENGELEVKIASFVSDNIQLQEQIGNLLNRFIEFTKEVTFLFLAINMG
jgi:predicted PurR-regulated permease PerM